MSTPTLAELITSKTKDEWLTLALSQLQGVGFPTTDWGSTAPERAMLETDAICVADLDTQIPLIVQLVLVAYASGDALRFLAHYFYGIDFFEATATVGNIKLTCNSLAGPYTIAVEQLIATDGAGHLYTNTAHGALATSGTLTPAWRALAVGAAYNVGNDTILTLQTPLPGVSVDNVPPSYSSVTHTGSGTGTLTLGGTPTGSHSVTVRIDTTGQSGAATWSTSVDGGAYSSQGAAASVVNLGGFGINITLVNGTLNPSFIALDTYSLTTPGTWITTQGTDNETDDSLRARILARWPSLAAVPTTDVYTAWALQAIPGAVTRVKVSANPSTTATVNIYCAGPSGPVSAAQVNAIQAYIDSRHQITDLPVVAASTTTAITITGTATYASGQASVPANRNAAITAYGNSVGLSSATGGNTVEIAKIIALAVNLDAAGVALGAINITGVQLNGVAADITLGSTAVAAITNSLTWTPV